MNGVRVAVIGAMTETLHTLTNPKALGTGTRCRWSKPCASMPPRCAAEADLIVLLGHINGEEEKAVLETVPEVQVLVTGHMHMGISQARSYDGRVLVRVKSAGEEFGRLDLKVDTGKETARHGIGSASPWIPPRSSRPRTWPRR